LSPGQPLCQRRNTLGVGTGRHHVACQHHGAHQTVRKSIPVDPGSPHLRAQHADLCHPRQEEAVGDLGLLEQGVQSAGIGIGQSRDPHGQLIS
jgi:hypothetical protein